VPTEKSPHDNRTAGVLRELLQARPDYRRQWQEQAERRRSDGISKAGVARVIALHLWGSGERADSEITLPRNLKDRVRRALDGGGITPKTLSWFIEAFGMDERDEQTLWATLAIDQEMPSGISYTMTSHRKLALKQRHRTIALFERYTIGTDRSFLTRRTLHTLMALEDGVDVYPFDHEPTADRVEVIYGGTLGASHRYDDGLQMTAIVLERPLKRGETVSLQYETHYPPGRYRGTEIRRSARGRSENIDIAVAFDPAALPSEVSWAVWRDSRIGSPVKDEAVTLDKRHTARRFVRFIEETVVGFRWTW
jgi:hypothetical protein